MGITMGSLRIILILVCSSASLAYDEITPTPVSTLQNCQISSLHLFELQKLITENNIRNVRLEERVKLLESTISELKNLQVNQFENLESSLLDQNRTIGNLDEKLTRQSISFDAYYSGKTLTTSHIIKFDHVSLNTGNSYDAFTGIFPAPFTGTYSFHSKARLGGSGYAALMVRKKNELSGKEVSLANGSNCMVWSNNAVIRLDAGDQMYVKFKSGTLCEFNGGIRTQFSG